ncbi:hypothetical protein [Magnetospirillum sp. LM-5]|uniref:hypothetical protein n=1 Tax=Magnetospirillum sp. LM-5 TaxID=2681466 RepID=UPI00156EB3F8|nr:hypothetical protein [Magnetospirillum sp. LM-5]
MPDGGFSSLLIENPCTAEWQPPSPADARAFVYAMHDTGQALLKALVPGRFPSLQKCGDGGRGMVEIGPNAAGKTDFIKGVHHCKNHWACAIDTPGYLAAEAAAAGAVMDMHMKSGSTLAVISLAASRMAE